MKKSFEKQFLETEQKLRGPILAPFTKFKLDFYFFNSIWKEFDKMRSDIRNVSSSVREVTKNEHIIV